MKVFKLTIWLLLVPLIMQGLQASVKKAEKSLKATGTKKKHKSIQLKERKLQDVDYGRLANKKQANGGTNVIVGTDEKKGSKQAKRKLQNQLGQQGQQQYQYGQQQNQYGQQQNQYGQQQGNGYGINGGNSYGYMTPKPDECDLSVEIFPLYYTPVIRASTFRLAFSSSCMTKRDINFEVYYKGNDFINFNHNPTIVNLELWGNFYNITYAKSTVIDPYDVMRSLEYREASIANLLDEEVVTLDVMSQNEVFLNPQLFNTFYKYTIDKIKNLDGLVKCTLFEKKVHGWELLKRVKDDARKRRQEQIRRQDEAVKRAQQETAEMMKNQQKMLKDSGRQLEENDRKLQEKGFSFYTPPPEVDYENIQQSNAEDYFADEDLTKFTDPEAAKAMRRNQAKKKIPDRNNVFGIVTSEQADYYDDKELPLESEAPVQEFESHKAKVKKLMNREYVEEYRISCKIE